MEHKRAKADIFLFHYFRRGMMHLGARMRVGSIRTRLLLAFVLMAMLSAIGISAGSMLVGYLSGREQVQDRLDSVAALKALSVRAWAETQQTGLLTVSSDQYASERVSVVLGLAKIGKNYIWYDDALRVRLRAFIDQSGQFQEICLLDLRGEVVLCSSRPRDSIDDCHAKEFFRSGLIRAYTEIVFSPPTREAQNENDSTDMSPRTAAEAECVSVSPVTRAPFAISARPVVSSQGETLGVIVGRAGLQELLGALADRTGLGSTGKAYLVSPSHEILSLDTAPSPINRDVASFKLSQGIAATLTNHLENSGIYQDYEGDSVLGIYHWLPDLHVVLAIEQSTSEAFKGIIASLTVNLSIAFVAALIAVAVSFIITRSITYPLVSLVETATQIAGGNLERTAPVLRDDELGMLATSFNTMTAQLRDLISHLEQRVQRRTQALNEANEALKRRALQMETSASLSRQITSILEIDELLARVVNLIRDAFGYSHARIFLLDDDELTLRASTGEMVAGTLRYHLSVPSLNGEAVQTSHIVVANDVTQDPRFLVEEQLPETRSELAIPLRVGDRVIGTLDVLSDQVNAFTADELLVNQSLGDQIAVAIENARLYGRSRELAVLEERHRLARDLHDSVIQSLYSLSLLFEGWRRLVRGGETANIEEYFGRAAVIAQQALKEMRLMVYELRPIALEQDGLLSAFRQRLDAIERRAGVKVQLVENDLSQLPMPLKECLELIPNSALARSVCLYGVTQGCRSRVMGYALYRIGMEALNNALKHSRGTEVNLELYTEDDQVVLRITDNGCGFSPDSPNSPGGMGLNNMRQRAQEIGGTLLVESAPGKGTAVIAKIRCTAFAASEVRSS